MKKTTIKCAVLTAVVILLAACGNSGDSGKQDNAPENTPKVDYSYIPEYTELGGGEFTSFQDIQFAGNCLYYDQVFFDIVNQKNVPVLKQYSLTENRILRERSMISNLEDGSRRQTGKYYVLEDGSMYTIESLYTNSSSETLLCSYDPDWNLRWEQDITAIMDEVRRYSSVDYIASDAGGQIYLAVEGTICLFDEEGTYQGTVTLENAWIGGLGADRNGKVYVCYRDQQSMEQKENCLAEVDFEKRELGAVYRNFPVDGGISVFAPGLEEDFLVNSAGCLYRYDLATQSAEELLEWAGCGINGNYVAAVSAGKDGDWMAFYRDIGVSGSSLVLLKKVETALLPEKAQIVIGCLGDSSELQSEVAAFNRQSDSCVVTILNYARKEDGTEADPRDFVNALSIALATGIDCPDILVLDQMEAYEMDIESIAGNGAFADLEPFLERSSLLKREDYLENALECYQYHGQLVGIPCEIRLRTIVGGTSDLGQDPGWTLEEMISYAAAHPEQQLFNGVVRNDILYDCLAFNLDAFIPASNESSVVLARTFDECRGGQCRFDSEDFRELLAFAATFPEEYDPQNDERSTPKMIQEGDVLLYKTLIYDFYGIQEHQVMFGEPVYIGYPATDGIGCIAECSGALALAAQSENPEEAWEFIEYYLERSLNSRWMTEFSTRKSFLEQQMEEAVTVSYYLDEEGNLLLDADGNPVPKSLGGIRWSFEDDEITFRTATEEEVNCVKELIESARPLSAADDRIMAIIQEEAEPFFQGQKSVEEVADIIQSRVQIYLDERQ